MRDKEEKIKELEATSTNTSPALVDALAELETLRNQANQITNSIDASQLNSQLVTFIYL